MFKNIKIPVEGNLDEIVKELKRRGYHHAKEFDHIGDINCVGCLKNGKFALLSDGMRKAKPTTLAELKEM